MIEQWRCSIGWLLALGCVVPALADDLPAVIGWAQKAALGTPLSGVVSEVHVRPGQTIGRGDRLVSLDDRGFRSRVSRRLAEYRHAEALLQEAQREDERALELYDRTVLSDFERNQALVALKAAQAAAERARAALVDARLDLERSVVSAPFDGVVLTVNVSVGQSVVSELQSQPLVVIADDRRMRARAEVDSRLAGALEPGQTLRASGGGALEAVVGHVGYEPVAVSDRGPLYELVVDIVTDRQRPLRVGETITLHLD